MCLQFPHLDVCSCWCLHRRDFLNLCVVTKILYISLVNFFLFVRANKFWMKGLWLYLNRRAHQGSCSSYCTSAFQGFPASASTLVSRELPPAWVKDSFLLLEKEVFFFFSDEWNQCCFSQSRAQKLCHLALKCSQQCSAELSSNCSETAASGQGSACGSGKKRMPLAQIAKCSPVRDPLLNCLYCCQI